MHLLHGRPLKVVGQLLGPKSIDRTGHLHASHVRVVNPEHFLEGSGIFESLLIFKNGVAWSEHISRRLIQLCIRTLSLDAQYQVD